MDVKKHREREGGKAQVVMKEAKFKKPSLTLYLRNKKGDLIAESKAVEIPKELEDFELLSFEEKIVVVELELEDGSKSKKDMKAELIKEQPVSFPVK